MTTEPYKVVRRVKKNYVNNRDFFDALVAYQLKRETNPEIKIPDYIGVCIHDICDRYSRKPNFSGYSYRDEMVSDAIEKCIAAVVKFKPEKSENPFGYMSLIALNAFIHRIGMEKKQQYVKHKNLENSHLMGIGAEMGDEFFIQLKNDEVSNKIIESYESKFLKPVKEEVIGLEAFVEDQDN